MAKYLRSHSSSDLMVLSSRVFFMSCTYKNSCVNSFFYIRCFWYFKFNHIFFIYLFRYTQVYGHSSALTALSLSNGALITSTTCGSTQVRGHMCVRSVASPSRTPAACVDTVRCTLDCGLISVPSALSLSPRRQTSNRSVKPIRIQLWIFSHMC